MAFSASLHIEGHPREQEGFVVTACSFSFSQSVDERGNITSRVHGGIINLTLKNVNDFDLMQWMIAPTARKNGKISFTSGVSESQNFQTIEFENGVLVSYTQQYSEQSEVTVNLTISCQQLDISGTSFVNEWQAPS